MPPPDRSDPGAGSGPSKYPGTFLVAFREALAGLGWHVRRWRGGAAECAEAQGEERVVGLDNLFRRARRTDREKWPALIAEFLTKVRAAAEDLGDVEGLDAFADRLLVRLGKPFAALPDQSKVWSQELAGTGLYVNLVIDQPETMTYVSEAMVAGSGRPGAAWLERALANLRARTPEGCLEEVHEESGLLLCGVGDAYDSSRALIAESLLPGEHPLGLLAALPSRDELLVLPVTPRALPHVHLMKLLAEKNFQKSPYPITDEVYWIREGAWRRFPIELRPDRVTVQPPAEFVALLDQLLPDGETGEVPDPESG